MSKKKAENLKKKYPVTVSDWLQYLESISSSNLTFVFGMLSLFFVTLTIVTTMARYQRPQDLTIIVASLVVISAAIIVVFLVLKKYILMPSLTESYEAKQLLNEILVQRKEELQNPEGIRKEWIKRTKKEPKNY